MQLLESGKNIVVVAIHDHSPTPGHGLRTHYPMTTNIGLGRVLLVRPLPDQRHVTSVQPGLTRDEARLASDPQPAANVRGLVRAARIHA